MYLPIVKAVRAGSIVLLFRFSLIDSEYMDVHAILPSINEARTLRGFLHVEKKFKFEVEHSIIETYCPLEIEVDWITYHAPAGLATSLCSTLLALALPDSIEGLNTLINTTRGSLDVIEQIRQMAILAGNDPMTLKNADIATLIHSVIMAEPFLVKAGILDERGLRIIAEGETEKEEFEANSIPDTDTINARAADGNAKLMRELAKY